MALVTTVNMPVPVDVTATSNPAEVLFNDFKKQQQQHDRVLTLTKTSGTNATCTSTMTIMSSEGKAEFGKKTADDHHDDDTSNNDHDNAKKKRPLEETLVSDDSSTDTSATTSSSNKRARTGGRRRVRFVTETNDCTTQVKEFHIDYDKDDVWWNADEVRLHMQRQSNLLQFYANTCGELVDSVLLVWVNCAEEALQDGTYCLTPQQRRDVANNVADSPVRGFEKELASDLITEQRQKTLQGLLELQTMCQLNNIAVKEKDDALAAASLAFSQTATLFARTMAEADAQVAHEYHAQAPSLLPLASS